MFPRITVCKLSSLLFLYRMCMWTLTALCLWETDCWRPATMRRSRSNRSQVSLSRNGRLSLQHWMRGAHCWKCLLLSIRNVTRWEYNTRWDQFYIRLLSKRIGSVVIKTYDYWGEYSEVRSQHLVAQLCLISAASHHESNELKMKVIIRYEAIPILANTECR